MIDTQPHDARPTVIAEKTLERKGDPSLKNLGRSDNTGGFGVTAITDRPFVLVIFGQTLVSMGHASGGVVHVDCSRCSREHAVAQGGQSALDSSVGAGGEVAGSSPASVTILT